MEGRGILPLEESEVSALTVQTIGPEPWQYLMASAAVQFPLAAASPLYRPDVVGWCVEGEDPRSCRGVTGSSAAFVDT